MTSRCWGTLIARLDWQTEIDGGQVVGQDQRSPAAVGLTASTTPRSEPSPGALCPIGCQGDIGKEIRGNTPGPWAAQAVTTAIEFISDQRVRLGWTRRDRQVLPYRMRTNDEQGGMTCRPERSEIPFTDSLSWKTRNGA